MTSGKGDGLSDEERKWMAEHLPSIMAKTGIHKAIRGQPIPQDDTDFRTATLALRGKFMAKFSESNRRKIEGGMTETKIERQFDDFVRNRKADAIRKWNKSLAKDVSSGSVSSSIVTPSVTNPLSSTYSASSTPPASTEIAQLWSSVFQQSPITGRALFEKENRAAINAEVNATRQSEGISHHQHVSMLKSAIKERWDGLGEDQDEWNDRAQHLSDSDMEEKEQRSRNQTIFDLSIAAVLRHLIGPIKDGNHKIGHARFHVLYGYRDEEDELHTGFIDVPDDAMRAPFDAFVDEYKTRFITPWHECCKLTVLENQQKPLPFSPARTIFTHDENGRPLFPVVCEEQTTPEALRSLLKDFIQTQWEFSVKQNNSAIKTLPPIPWNDSSALVDPMSELIDPASAKTRELYDLLSDFKSRQSLTSGFQIFKFLESTSISDTPPTVFLATSSPAAQDLNPQTGLQLSTAVITTSVLKSNEPVPVTSTAASPPATSSAAPIPGPEPGSFSAMPPLSLGSTAANTLTVTSSTPSETLNTPGQPIQHGSQMPGREGTPASATPPTPPVNLLTCGPNVDPSQPSSAASGRKKKQRAKPTPLVKDPVTASTPASSECNPGERKGKSKRKAEESADGPENVKRAKGSAGPVRRSARQLHADTDASSSKPLSTIAPVPDGSFSLRNGKPATSAKNFFYALVPNDR